MHFRLPKLRQHSAEDPLMDDTSNPVHEPVECFEGGQFALVCPKSLTTMLMRSAVLVMVRADSAAALSSALRDYAWLQRKILENRLLVAP